jgi:hypothetical protein
MKNAPADHQDPQGRKVGSWRMATRRPSALLAARFGVAAFLAFLAARAVDAAGQARFAAVLTGGCLRAVDAHRLTWQALGGSAAAGFRFGTAFLAGEAAFLGAIAAGLGFVTAGQTLGAAAEFCFRRTAGGARFATGEVLSAAIGRGGILLRAETRRHQTEGQNRTGKQLSQVHGRISFDGR